LRTLRAGVDLNGQVITMLDRSYLAAGMPTLIVWGLHDRIIPVKHAAIAHCAIPGSRLRIFNTAGHFPHHDDPAGFAATVETFLTDTEPSQYDPVQRRRLLRAGRHASPAGPAQLHASSGS
jgi:pimeloyl-ACP methyl ester carboxylesterase